MTKPGGRVVFAVPNTEAQMRWTLENQRGWDGKDLFTSASEKIFGSLDYPENSHKAFFSPAVAVQLFQEAGFADVVTSPYGARSTDLLIEANKPDSSVAARIAEVEKQNEVVDGQIAGAKSLKERAVFPDVVVVKVPPREEWFDRRYFNGANGPMGGGFIPFYCDFPCHEITARHVLIRKPESVLELGCARGYVIKRLQDAGIEVVGLDISLHCQLTKVCESIIDWDICKTPWPDCLTRIEGKPGEPSKREKFDLCFSIAFLEHVPEEYLPFVAAEMERTCKLGLHGVTFSAPADSPDKTRVTLRPKEWWLERLPPGHEVVDKNELENGNFPQEVLNGDAKIKLNVGSATTFFHHGWVNTDVLDLAGHAQNSGYKYLKNDARNGIPFPTEGVDLIFASHFLEHLTCAEGLAFLKDCRRVIKPSGAIRLVVPNTRMLANCYAGKKEEIGLEEFDELNEGCANAPTLAAKFWALACDGHKAFYDEETLQRFLEEAQFKVFFPGFRKTECGEVGQQILLETTEMSYGNLSLFCEAVPFVG